AAVIDVQKLHQADESSYASIFRLLQELTPTVKLCDHGYVVEDGQLTHPWDGGVWEIAIAEGNLGKFHCKNLKHASLEGTLARKLFQTVLSSTIQTVQTVPFYRHFDYLCDFWAHMGRPSEGSLCEELWRAWSRISYFVDLGCMVITVAAQLTEEDVSMIYEHFPKFQLWYSRHVVLSASRPDIQNADVIAQMFDGEAICEDFHSIMCNSTVGRLNTLWLLREAGYQATWKEKDGLIVSYRSFMHHPPVPKHTFLKFVQSSLGGDISSIMPK
ncbi:MAG: hypothetical protein QMC37_01400, partial [Flavobacteriales bacterium]